MGEVFVDILVGEAHCSAMSLARREASFEGFKAYTAGGGDSHVGIESWSL